MNQLAILSTGLAAFFHPVPDGVHHSPFLFLAIDHCTLFFFFFKIFLLCDRFSLGSDLTSSYPAHFPTLISTAPTLVTYLLSSTDIATLITNYPNYPIDPATVLTTYPTNLVTLLITYPTNLTLVLTTYSTNLATLHTQPLYSHKYFTN